MSNYNLVTGIDQGTLDLLSSQLYAAIYPRIFRGTFPVGTKVGQFQIDSVSYDVQAAPEFQLQPSQAALDELHAQVDAMEVDEALRGPLHEAMDDVVTFGLTLPKVVLEVSLASGTMGPFTASIQAGCRADFQGGGRFVLSVLTAALQIPGQSALSNAINQCVMPQVIQKLNAALAGGWQVPPISFQNVSFGPPVVRTEHGTVLAGYSTLAGGGAVQPPAGAPWSQPGEFLLFDDAVAEAVTAAVLATLQRSGSTSATIGKWPLDLNVSASYEVGLRTPVYSIQGNNTTQVSIAAYGGGHVTVKLGALPSVTLGISISAAPNVLARFQLAGRQALFTFYQVLGFDVNVAFDSVPSWLNQYVSQVLTVITTPIAQLIGAMLSGLTVPVYQIPEVPVKAGDLSLLIDPDNLRVDTTFDGQKYLAAAYGTVTVKGATVPGVESAPNLYAAPEPAAAD